jgi:ubiquinone/menaquinone biosynthesis C-methylase UbiE
MIKYILEILNAKGNDTVVLKYLVFLAIIVFVYLLYKYILRQRSSIIDNQAEGFSQEQPFVLKIDKQVYDEFYVDVYDEIYSTEKNSNWLIEQIIKMTEPNKESIMLDIGSGTGKLMNTLKKMEYNIYGVDNSRAMVEYSEKKYPAIEVKYGDTLDPMLFENLSFTHILCVNFTIYQIQDKKLLLRNFYNWLKPNTYLILHLVDPDNFSSIAPLQNKIQWMPFFKSEKPRTTDSISEFDDYKYKQSFSSNKTTNITKLTETFTNKENNHIRQNEQTLYMEPVDHILTMASSEGFILHGKVDMNSCNGDKYQYLYILERIM